MQVAGDELSNTVIDVGVYYESLCPDSIRFIKNGLVPAYDTLKDNIRVTFVPYGKASVRNIFKGKQLLFLISIGRWKNNFYMIIKWVAKTERWNRRMAIFLPARIWRMPRKHGSSLCHTRDSKHGTGWKGSTTQRISCWLCNVSEKSSIVRATGNLFFSRMKNNILISGSE